MLDAEWERLRATRVAADCREGKHAACTADSWCMEADVPADCECDCHHKEGK